MDRLLLRFMSVTPRYPVWVRYLLSLGLVGLAFVANLLLDDQLRQYPLILFIPAIFLASVIFDRGSGFLATGASAALAARYFIPPSPGAAILPLLVFLASGLCIAAVTEALRTTLEKHSEAKAYADVLMMELAHRTRNDLATIISILRLQARSDSNPAVQAAITSALTRIEVVANVHDRLRDTAVNSTVDLASYLEALCGSLSDFHRGVRPIAIRGVLRGDRREELTGGIGRPDRPRRSQFCNTAQNALKLPSLPSVDSLAFALRLWLLYPVASESPVSASRPYWKGYLKLSFVSCPIALYPAISAAERVSFRQVNRRTGHRLKHKLVDSITGEAVDAAEMARGYEVGENEFLLVEDRDLEHARSERPAPVGAVELAAPRRESPPIAPAGVQNHTREGSAGDYDDEAGELEEAAPIPRPQNTRTIEIEHFVPAGQIDAGYFEKPYYIVPREEIGPEAFAVIRDAMSREAVVGLARVVLSSRERVFLVEPTGGGFRGIALRFAHELRNASEYFSEIPEVKLPSEMMTLAQHIIRSKSTDFDPALLEDHYRSALRRILRKKQARRPAQPSPIKPSPENIVNLMDALRRSIDAGRPAKPERRGAGKPAAARRGARHRTTS
ncbi:MULTISPECIES: Ku protein [unclassified Bradyrhizobium]|uniref:non-homologous end joining protein Ku n=1 Tax=unclassified Bradyrhizobium TaxID=2631580 RepID=UPI001FFB1A59|nr:MULTISPECIES: Ku protein [unclassified Bradyrhizobium]MCK1727122.1 DUF4118 domain-containing protein [Bradyrhizobium sp. 142]